MDRDNSLDLCDFDEIIDLTFYIDKDGDLCLAIDMDSDDNSDTQDYLEMEY